MTERSKGERVWVAVTPSGILLKPTVAATRRVSRNMLDCMWPVSEPDWSEVGYTIRRATLTLDPVKPKRMTKTERIAVQSVVNRTRRRQP